MDAVACRLPWSYKTKQYYLDSINNINSNTKQYYLVL